MWQRFIFLLTMLLAAGLRLSRREEAPKTAEILILRHQLVVLQRLQPRCPKLDLGGPGPACALLGLTGRATRYAAASPSARGSARDVCDLDAILARCRY
jgi:hypothetical protein